MFKFGIYFRNTEKICAVNIQLYLVCSILLNMEVIYLFCVYK